ncbi:MAG: ABC transporter permease subunit [Treponema sp.]|jgi:arabinogalactan oligomer/maltooligosaccharide transport system permease protein|nr:ABC transporter permease subunit [Treponema sp.]
MTGIKKGEFGSLVVSHIVLIILAVIWLYPILWVVLSAFRVEYNDQGDLIGIVVSHYFPRGLGFENFKRLFTTTYFGRWVMNTLIVAVFSTTLSTLLSLSTSYVMSKMRFKLRKPIMNIALILGLFPGFMSIIAVYYILKALGLTQSLAALVLVYSVSAGLGFYIGKGFFDTIPDSLIEAAKLDGAMQSRIFISVVLPLSRPIIIYIALMAFMVPWMDFIMARVILGEQNVTLHTTAVGLYYMLYGQRIDSNVFTLFSAGCLLIAVPIVSLFLSMQKFYVEGITAGSVKS